LTVCASGRDVPAMLRLSRQPETSRPSGFPAVLARVLGRHGIGAGDSTAQEFMRLTEETVLSQGVRSTGSPLAAMSLDVAAEWFAPSIRALVHQFGLRGDDAVEALQRVIIGLPSAVSSLPIGEPRKVLGWLATRVRFVCRDVLRWDHGTTRTGRDGTVNHSRGTRVNLDRVDECIGLVPDVVEQLIVEERLNEVRRMIASMSGPDRTVLLAIVVAGRSHEDVAREMGTTVAACKMRLARVRRALRDRLQTEEER
jgi:RNA polymerase sigma factor (sigma-70 family)